MPFGFGKKAASESRELDIRPFLRAWPRDPASASGGGWTADSSKRLVGRDLPGFTAFMEHFAGASFGGGILRFLDPAGQPSIFDWNSPNGGWHDDWPSMPQGIAFATDWLGRLYLFDPRPLRGGDPPIGLLDPAAGQYERTEWSFEEFVGPVLADDGRGLLDADRFAAWTGSGGRVPGMDECVGYKVPLILGGAADASNMEVSSLVVWVSLSGQIYEQTKDLPEGAQITGINIEGR